MGRYSDEEKAESIRRAYETLERLDEQRAAADAEPEPAWPTRPDILDPMQRSSAGMDKWRGQAAAAEARREKAREREQTMDEINAQRSAQWDAFVRGHIEAALTEHDKICQEAIGMALAHERKLMRDHVAEQLGQLRADLTIAKAHERGKVTDLPNPLTVRKRNAA